MDYAIMTSGEGARGKESSAARIGWTKRLGLKLQQGSESESRERLPSLETK